MKKCTERRYFKRDVSWLSFNYRVLLEAKDRTLPLYDRIRFLSIYSSNLEEFYRVRISEYRQTLAQQAPISESSVREAQETLDEINREASRQLKTFNALFHRDITEALANEGIVLCSDESLLSCHRDFVATYFREEIFPFLQPVLILKDEIRSFLRDSRLYLMVRLYRKSEPAERRSPLYALIKIPYAKVPRFVELPPCDGVHYLIFVEDVIAANLAEIFPGFEVDAHYGIRVSRDADFEVRSPQGELVDEIRRQVNKRKIGAANRLVYDAAMPASMLDFLCEVYGIDSEQCIPAGKYRTMEDLIKLPNPTGRSLSEPLPTPLRIEAIDRSGSVSKLLKKEDILLCYPYHTFDYLIRFLTEAAYDPKVERIRITQYRVAENSGVVDALITAARNGKAVTVFVELKARFDEVNNIESAQRMSKAGIRIVYSAPGFKVHAKLALVMRRVEGEGRLSKSSAYLSTGNFNEKTARVYADFGLFTRQPELLEEVDRLFSILEGAAVEPRFDRLLVSPYNMVEELLRKIAREAGEARAGRSARIVLKMNGLQDKTLIDALYDASDAGVQIDLIVRGICCLVPEQPFSRNIRVTRLVDSYLEHARVWYFQAAGAEELYLSSADWMKRNLTRRVECAFPVLSEPLKRQILAVLQAQLRDNVKACTLDGTLQNRFRRDDRPPFRAQRAVYESLRTGEPLLFSSTI